MRRIITVESDDFEILCRFEDEINKLLEKEIYDNSDLDVRGYTEDN